VNGFIAVYVFDDLDEVSLRRFAGEFKDFYRDADFFRAFFRALFVG
jgi:hypothetical protein